MRGYYEKPKKKKKLTYYNGCNVMNNNFSSYNDMMKLNAQQLGWH